MSAKRELDKHTLLTAEQIEEIGFVLHENMQFFDAEGNKANGAVLDKIEEILTQYMGGR